MRHLLAALAMIAAAPLCAQTALPPAPYSDTQLPDAALEAKATALMATIRCLTCQSQSIIDSNASMAADLRSQIRERIARGEDPEAIRAWLIKRYGDWISYKPTASPVLWPLWIAPVLLVGAGGALAFGRIRRRPASGGSRS